MPHAPAPRNAPVAPPMPEPPAAHPWPMDRRALTAALRARQHRVPPSPSSPLARGSVPLCPAIDQALPAGGLARAGLHEFLAADPAAAAAFCALLLARAAAGHGAVLWIAADPTTRPAGLARFGLAPADLILVRAPAPADAHWAMEEALRCPGIAAALLVTESPPTPGAATRLQQAAGTGGGLGLLLGPDDEGPGPGEAALTRWRVTALSDSAAPLEDPRWQLELLRCRGGQPGTWPVTWRPAAESLTLDAADPPEGPGRHHR